MNDEKGQLSGEYMLLVGSLIVVLMISIFMIANENELNIAMAAAKSGADEGVASSSSAIYPKERRLCCLQQCCIEFRGNN